MIDAEKLRAMYQERKMPQGEFASLIGISQAHLSQILAGKKQPSIDIAAAIAQVLGVKVDDILLPNPPLPSMGRMPRQSRERRTAGMAAAVLN